jgi:hypothetical protein
MRPGPSGDRQSFGQKRPALFAKNREANFPQTAGQDVTHFHRAILSVGPRILAPPPLPCFRSKKKADVVEHPKVFDHVGLLVSEPPGPAGLPSSSLPTTFTQALLKPSAAANWLSCTIYYAK